ncbi:MAG TPA: hypothetical protein DCQ42_09100, partial [Halomonas sp.]|nr:hypothetical protein [Halomonas sp.]
MAAPWEKYQQQQPLNAAPAKPWERYASQETPVASEQPAGLAMDRAPQQEQPQSPVEQPSDTIR